MSDPMYPPPPPPSPPPPPYNPPPMGGGPMGGGPMGGGGAAQAVQSPAMGLMITGVIGLLLGALGLLMNLLGLGMQGMSDLGGGGGPADQYMQYMSGGMGIVSAIIGLGISGFIVWASMQMKQLRNWNMSVAASIVAMIPCIGPCCLIGIPIGIWSLMTLMKPEVKSAFVG